MKILFLSQRERRKGAAPEFSIRPSAVRKADLETLWVSNLAAERKVLMKYIVVIYSNSTHQREYETNSRSALKAADKFGRCEAGEVVIVKMKNGKIVSRSAWTPENGGRYFLTTI